MINLNDFINRYNGKPADYDGYYGTQCVDLVQFWCKENGWPRFSGNAKDIFGQHPNEFDQIRNTSSAIPKAGDILVWGEGLGPYGHTAIFVEGDVYNFRSFDANFPLGTLPHIQAHNYYALIGWLHPKQNIVIPPMPAVFPYNGQIKSTLRTAVRRYPHILDDRVNAPLRWLDVGTISDSDGYTNNGSSIGGNKKWWKIKGRDEWVDDRGSQRYMNTDEIYEDVENLKERLAIVENKLNSIKNSL